METVMNKVVEPQLFICVSNLSFSLMFCFKFMLQYIFH